MGLNIDFIDSSIPGYTRTSQLTQHIKSELGGFVGHRKYLDKIEVVKTLGLMGYDTARASELADYFLKCVESAFERGVFVVSSRVIKLKGITPKTPNELVAMLVEKEPGYFDPLHWYELWCKFSTRAQIFELFEPNHCGTRTIFPPTRSGSFHPWNQWIC